jgi:hypothetical protein
MAHFNIFDQACGMMYDSTKLFLSYDPRMNQDRFRCFCSLNGGWGMFSQDGVLGEETILVGSKVGDSGSNNSNHNQTIKRTILALASGHADLKCLWGTMSVCSLGLRTTATSATATLNGKPINVSSFANGIVTFGAVVSLVVNDVLSVAVDGGVEVVDTSIAVGSSGGCCSGSGNGVGIGFGGCCGGEMKSNNVRPSHGHEHGHGHGHGRPPTPVDSGCCNNGGSCKTGRNYSVGCCDEYNDDFDNAKNAKKGVAVVSSSTSNILQIVVIFICGMITSYFIQQLMNGRMLGQK